MFPMTAQKVASGLGVSLERLSEYARRSHIVDPGNSWSLADVKVARSSLFGRKGSTALDDLIWPPEPEPEPEPEAEEDEDEDTGE